MCFLQGIGNLMKALYLHRSNYCQYREKQQFIRKIYILKMVQSTKKDHAEDLNMVRNSYSLQNFSVVYTL